MKGVKELLIWLLVVLLNATGISIIIAIILRIAELIENKRR